MGEAERSGGRIPEWVEGDKAQSAAFEEAVEWAGFADRARESKSLWAGNAAIFACAACYAASQGMALATAAAAAGAGLCAFRMGWRALEQGAAKRLMAKALAGVEAPLPELARGVGRHAQPGERAGFALAAFGALEGLRARKGASERGAEK